VGVTLSDGATVLVSEMSFIIVASWHLAASRKD